MGQLTRNSTVVVGTAQVEVLAENFDRTAFYITNTGGAAVTLVKGNAAAAVGAGIVLQPNNTWFESKSEGFQCWQGRVQVIAAVAGSVGVSETLEPK